MSPERRRARRGQGDLLRDEIVRAATDLLVQSDDAGAVTVRAVASTVGVSPPAIYLHFADKDALLVAVCVATFDQLDAVVEAAAAEIADPLEALRARGRAYVQFGLENPEHYRLLFMTRKFFDVPPEELMRTAAFDHHHASVAAAAEGGLLQEGIDPMLAAIVLWAGVHGITSLLIAKPNFPWPPLDALLDGVLGSLVRGVSR